jgi:hypothetical protein
MARTKGTKDEQLAALRRRVREQQARLSSLECDKFVLKQRLGLAKVIINKHTEGTASVLKTLRRTQRKMPTDLEEDMRATLSGVLGKDAGERLLEFLAGEDPTDYDSDKSDYDDATADADADDDATADADAAGTSSVATAELGRAGDEPKGLGYYTDVLRPITYKGAESFDDVSPSDDEDEYTRMYKRLGYYP